LIYRNKQETAEAETTLIYFTAQALILYAIFLGRLCFMNSLQDKNV